MQRLRSLDEFKLLRDRITSERDPRTIMVIPTGTCGQASGANDLIRMAKRVLLEKELIGKIGLRITGCHGFCEMEPSLLIEPEGTFYPRVNIDDIPRIIDAICRKEVVKDLLYVDPESGRTIARQSKIPFFSRQVRTLMSMNEKIDPIRIFQYIENGGYSALAKILEARNPLAIVDEVKKSGLRGRGGAGFPTGLKWELLAKQHGKRGKYLVCNADEGDPGAYMDRSLLEGNPHSIIEGMIIGAYATGATDGVVYVRNEYPLAIKHLTIAIRQAREMGFLGEDIINTRFSFDIKLVRGAGAFVCGEETSLIHSIEGQIGEPRQRPPFPVQKGIFGKPTAINNVETWANIPIIMRESSEEFSKVGTPHNSGTKIFSLVGKVRNTGLVEVPMGTTINEIVNEIGGGSAGSSKIKAVQTGGPSGGCIPANMFNMPIDYDSLNRAGSIMGSGGMIVMDENTCMVDVAKYFMNFLKDESCGKCFTCRKGTQRMYEILDDVSKGLATAQDIDLLEELAYVVKDTSMCGLGQSAPNPILSNLRYFKDEYLEHVVDKECDAGVCRELVGAPCQAACPLGTEAWRYVAHIAKGEYDEAYMAIREANPFPSVCARVCNHPCESKCRAGTSGGDPIAIRALKRFVTDRVDPRIYSPRRHPDAVANGDKVAIIGAGPAGLTAAHYLSLRGYKSTVFDSECKPGGMMFTAIPAYRLPREVIEKEIESLLDENVTLQCETALGKDITIDELFHDGYKAVFLALGAHKSRPLRIEGENAEGVYPSIQFLREFNVSGKKVAKGAVGVIGGGNSAVDAARVAIRQEDVDSVTIFYRRTRNEMPAYPEEIEAAIQEGIKIEPLISPNRVITSGGKLSGIECVANMLGDRDSSGRRRPVPIENSEFIVPLDTLIVAISEGSDIDCLSVASSMQIKTDVKSSTVVVDQDTMSTNRPGVFAGGDLVTGPNTIVDAIAAGKKAAVIIDRYIKGEELKQTPRINLPEVFVPPPDNGDAMEAAKKRVATPRAMVEWRKRGFAEVEMSLTKEEAKREALRCMRCDLEFTKPEIEQEEELVPAEGSKL
ncbi:MAG: FAD-dependent oxidoreductase [Phycisphaerae bacterium]|nr:FAD-dependent oxidoreductase [Gammaproteobacteria bacterium]NIS16398.1 FAD-dependent oxidoreductase [candidate division Zixibacteria bacterium]NIU59200.1 FAD-dependent oxidoreductase [Phycisphaerae bacterium]NIW95532.1 FAD-dependent oxidoreductase [Phycisphaerae bacterium]